MEVTKVNLFVYGTLLAGEPYHHLLGDAPLLGKARTQPGYILINLGEYPGLQKGGSGSVHGEVYTINRSLLAVLDKYEDYPLLYDRILVPLDDGKTALTYILRSTAPLPVIESGDWQNR